MPNFSKGKYNNQHDNRGRYQQDPVIRKVSFKNNQRGRHQRGNRRGAGHGRGLENHMREFFHNEIDDYQPGPSTYHHNRGGGRGGRVPHIGGPLPEFKPSPTGWYKVTVTKAAKYEKSYLIGLIREHVKPYEFEFYCFNRIDGETYTFFVPDFDLAEKLYLSARGRIKTVTGHTLCLIVQTGTPYVELTDELKAKIKLVMAKRYNAENNALDMSNFCADPEFKEANLFVPVDRINVMTCICKIIGDNLTDLYALNMSENKINYKESLVALVKVIPQCKILYLSKNNIKEISAIRALEPLSNLEQIKLDKNPWAENFTDQDSYLAEVRKVFPKIIKLDDIELPPPIVFDLEETFVLPKPQGSFLCHPDAREILRAFLEQYFAMFDSANRAGLIAAYHEDAQYSVAVISGQGNNHLLMNIISESRNLLRIEDPQRQKSLLAVGKKEIMRSLRLLPSTKHDLMSFTCDCPLFTPGLIQFSVTGLFEDLSPAGRSKTKLIRSFNRAFLLVPRVDGGFAIINDQLLITSATHEQEQGSFSSKVPEESASQAPAAGGVSDEIVMKQNMVKSLSQASGMNLTYSENCLTEVAWDFDRAVSLVTQLKASNGLPAEAFV